eukprot:tig00000692_g3232.t1
MSVDIDALKRRWTQAYEECLEADTWGQIEEATEGYHLLAMTISDSASSMSITTEQRQLLMKLALTLELRSKAIKATTSPGITLDHVKRLKPVFPKLFTDRPVDFPVDLGPFAQAKLEFERQPTVIEGEAPPGVDSTLHTPTRLPVQRQAAAVAAPEARAAAQQAPARAAAPRPAAPIPVQTPAARPAAGSSAPAAPAQRGIVVEIDRIGLKDYHEYVDPFITVSVLDSQGMAVENHQDTPISTMRKPDYVIFGTAVQIQTPFDKLPNGAAIVFEFKHWKAKKKKNSVRCWSFVEKSELKQGPMVLELYTKPMVPTRKQNKLSLFTSKPLYLHININIDG